MIETGEPGVEAPRDRAIRSLERATQLARGLECGPVEPLDAECWSSVAPELVRVAVEGILLAEHPGAGLQRFFDEGGMGVHLPEVAALVGFGEGDRRHKDVWEHTKKVVAQAPARPALRWAALLHDIGKVPTRRVSPGGEVSFHGHAEVGSRMARRILRRLGFPPELGRRIRLLVKHHQRPSQYAPGWTDSAVRRFGRETEEILDDLLDLSRADMTTRFAGKRRRGHELIDELARRLEEIRELDARVPPLPSKIGRDIIERFGLVPGPRIGRLRRALEEAVERGELEAQQEPEVYLAWLERHLDEIP